MSVSFITNTSSEPKNIREMSNSDINKLYTILSGPISQINSSGIKIVKNQAVPIPLNCLTPHGLSMLCTSVSNFRSGHTNKVYTCYHEKEIQLILAMAENDANVSRAAEYLKMTRDELRATIKRFETKWSLDLTTYTGLCQAYAYAMAS